VFRLILDEMLVKTHGALAALFVDYEGETVALTCDRDLSDHALRVLGAYQVVYFDRLRAICSRVSDGSPHRFKIEFDAMSVLSWDVKDGYSIVLLVDGSVNEGLAWRGLQKCRERLLEEM
jgi:hypothetical protein